MDYVDENSITISVPVARTVYTTVAVDVPTSCNTQQDVLEYVSTKVAGGELDGVIDAEWMNSPDGDDWCVETQDFEVLNKSNEAYSSLPVGGSVTPEKMKAAVDGVRSDAEASDNNIKSKGLDGKSDKEER